MRDPEVYFSGTDEKLTEKGNLMGNKKKLTILHSNDLHGDFLAEKVDDRLIGGVSRLSGYVNKTRLSIPNSAGFPLLKL